LLEDGQGRMGGPPWSDVERYLRNSPIMQVNRITTPLLIIQGDLDFIPVQQGEEMFTGLRRLGKRVTFVRYWGEGHSIDSPANIRDMWKRVFQWFDNAFASGDTSSGMP
jgi:dipeptidyl aminopeptidase/acylaminoacyl peptidase